MSQPVPLTGLQQLVMLADAAKRAKHPNVPEHGRVTPKYSDKTANDLTTAIVDWFDLQADGFGTRLASTGTYRDDLQRFVKTKQKTGLPDCLGFVGGQCFAVEVKMPGDRLSEIQKERLTQLKQAGVKVFIAATFQGFFTWYNQVTALPFQ